MDLRVALIAGTDIAVPECPIIIHQPRIKEIAFLGETNFFIGVQTLCLDKKSVAVTGALPDDVEITNFELVMMLLNSPEGANKKKTAQQLLEMICPGYKILFTPRSILFNKEDTNIILDESNFEIFQNILRQVFCISNSNNNQNYNPANAKAKEIADKLMRGRARVAAEKGEDRNSVFAQYVSILTVGLSSMSLQDALELTMYQMYDLIERLSLYTNWNLDIKMRLAGGKPDSSPDNWMKNIH